MNIVKTGRKENVLKMISHFIKNDRGEMVGTIGWMAIVATVLVLVHGLITGWLPGFVNKIFSSLETLV